MASINLAPLTDGTMFTTRNGQTFYRPDKMSSGVTLGVISAQNKLTLQTLNQILSNQTAIATTLNTLQQDVKDLRTDVTNVRKIVERNAEKMSIAEYSELDTNMQIDTSAFKFDSDAVQAQLNSFDLDLDALMNFTPKNENDDQTDWAAIINEMTSAGISPVPNDGTTTPQAPNN